MIEFLQTLGWVLLFTAVAGIISSVLVLAVGTVLPRFLNKLSPKIDEEKEIAGGNVAVATYFGKIVASCILGVSIVISTSIIGAVLLLK